MSDHDRHDETLAEPVRRHRRRAELWRREGERSVGRNLAWIGALGWLVVTPMVLGAFLGRWIDGHFGTGITWTAALIFVGAGAGGWLVWQRIHQE